MALSVENYIVTIPAGLSILAVLVCLARGIWVYQLFSNRRFYKRHFDRLSEEANELSAETANLRLSVVQDEDLNPAVQIAYLEIINAAHEYDTGIQIALVAWEAMIHPAEQDSKTEIGMEEGAEMRKGLGKRHRRHVISNMRKRCMEGMEKRKKLSPQMQWMLRNVASRDCARLANAMSGALSTTTSDSDLEKDHQTSNNFSTSFIPDFESGDGELYRQEECPVSRQTYVPQGRDIIPDKYRNFSLLSPTTTTAATFGQGLSVPASPRRDST